MSSEGSSAAEPSREGGHRRDRSFPPPQKTKSNQTPKAKLSSNNVRDRFPNGAMCPHVGGLGTRGAFSHGSKRQKLSTGISPDGLARFACQCTDFPPGAS